MEVNGNVQRCKDTSQQMSAGTTSRANEDESRKGKDQERANQSEVG
jgi:hypothetical protein